MRREKSRGRFKDLVRAPGFGKLALEPTVLLLHRLRGPGGGLCWPVPVAPDPQRLLADTELRGDRTDRCCTGTTLASLTVLDHTHSTLTQFGTELLRHTPILLAETRNETQDASDEQLAKQQLGTYRVATTLTYVGIHMSRRSFARHRRLAIVLATATLILTPLATASAGGTDTWIDVTAVGISDSAGAFSAALDQYLTGPVSHSGVPTFDRDRALIDGASDDLVQAGDFYNQMMSAYASEDTGDDITATKLPLPVWGNWCGPGYGGGPAVDLLDRACRAHDKCYARKGYFNCSCDRSLIGAINRDYNRMHTTEKIAATAVKAYFSAQMKVKC